MSLDYRIAPLPPVWPGKATPAYARRRAPFKTIETKALDLLEREVRMLGGKNVEIAVDVEPRHIRNDGKLYANARPRSPAVVVSFDTKEGRLAFPCDTFGFFWANVDAVARALEALRMVDRYGVQQGRQYTGFKALPPATAPTMSVEAAALLVGTIASRIPSGILNDRALAREAVRIASARSHPDAGGDPDDFSSVQQAKRVLEAHHGGGL